MGLDTVDRIEIGHRIPAGKYHGLADSLIVLALLLGCWYSILLLLMLIPLSVLVVYMVGAITFYTSKLILWVLFKPAADPAKSPFKFASTMLGLWVLFSQVSRGSLEVENVRIFFGQVQPTTQPTI